MNTLGTIVLVGLNEEGRELIDIPKDVKRWKIRARANKAMTLILSFEDRIELWALAPVGAKYMKPVICQRVNYRMK